MCPFCLTAHGRSQVLREHRAWLSVHFEHPRELSPPSIAALDRLSGHGVPLGNQSVLLRGVNDDPEVFVRLMQLLVKYGVRPYYLYQCDLSRRIEHFRTSVAHGVRLIERVRGHTSGFCQPHLVVDLPEGGGKVTVGPNYIVSSTDGVVRFRNFETGRTFVYHEPEGRQSTGKDSLQRMMNIAGGDAEKGSELESGAGKSKRFARSKLVETKLASLDAIAAEP
jgi:lysine 2,3-aminomutase